MEGLAATSVLNLMVVRHSAAGHLLQLGNHVTGALFLLRQRGQPAICGSEDVFIGVRGC